MELNAILNLLADGEFHSGAELGEVLGVSRTAVWKHLQKLEPLGLPLTSIKGKGYCIEGGLELLEAGCISDAMDSGARDLIGELDILSVTDSTNMQALAKARNGYICLAEQQTAGKGRRGRQWVSPFGKNIYLSATWGFDGGVAALEGLSLAVGVAIVAALERCGLSGVRLKWPNDVLWQQRKLAGVLLEMSGDVDGYCQVVVGIGLNVNMPAQAGEAIDQAWVDVESIAREQGLGSVSRNRLVSMILSELLPMLQNFQQQGFAAYRERWESLDAFRDRSVVLSTSSQSVSGIAMGVSETGALKVLVDGREQLFNGGEVSLRQDEDR